MEEKKQQAASFRWPRSAGDWVTVLVIGGVGLLLALVSFWVIFEWKNIPSDNPMLF